MSTDARVTDLARLLQQFFCQHLMQQRHVSPRTVSSYRDTFRLLLRFAEQQLNRAASTLQLGDIDASLVLSFLDHLEEQRHNSIRSRNARYAAIRAFLHYAARQEPMALAQIQRVLAIPMKRFERPVVGFLSAEEMEAIIQAPDPATWSGQRDQILLMMLYNTGARVSEIIAVRREDVSREQGRAVHLHGKGRKERVVPLWKRTAGMLRSWMLQIGPEPTQPLLPNRFGQPMSRSGVEQRLQQAVTAAAGGCPSLQARTVSPHVIRHTTAMQLLQAGVDLAVIALWLGHESVVTTHQYLQADLSLKERALAALQPPQTRTRQFQPTAEVLAFLDAL